MIMCLALVKLMIDPPASCVQSVARLLGLSLNPPGEGFYKLREV